MLQRTLSLLLTLLLSLTLGAPGERAETLAVVDEDFLPGEEGYAFPGLAWGAGPEETARALGVDLGEAEETRFPDLGFTRVLYHPDAALEFLGLTADRLDVEFRDGGLWCVDATWAPREDVSGEFARILAKLTALLGEPDQRDARGGAFCVETRRWTAEWREGLVSALIVQMSGRSDAYTVLQIGWLLADPVLLSGARDAAATDP